MAANHVAGLDMTYTGPIKVKTGPSKVATLIVNRSLANNILSSGSGLVTNIYSSADVVSVTDWASLQNIWKEYRVLALEVEWIPIAATTTTPICVAIVGDHNPSLSSLTSMNDAVSYDNVKLISGGAGVNITSGKYPKYSMRASGVEELAFVPILSAPTTGIFGIKTYSTVGTNSVVYFEVIERFTIEFRGSG